MVGPFEVPFTVSPQKIAHGVAEGSGSSTGSKKKHFGLPEGLHGDRVRGHNKGGHYVPVVPPCNPLKYYFFLQEDYQQYPP